MSTKHRDQQQNRQQPYPGQVVTGSPASPVVQFANPEAQASVTGPLRDKYQTAVSFAHAEWDQARACQSDIDKWLQEIADAEQDIEDRKEWVKQRKADLQQHMVHGQQNCDVANPAAELLAIAGIHVDRITAPLITSVPPTRRPRDRKVHPLDTSQPLPEVPGEQQPAPADPDPTGLQSSMSDPAAGYCIRCGQPVWRTAVTKASPNGLTHGWGASCDPNAETPQYADLGEERQVAS